MTTRTLVTYLCDLCGTEEDVETRQLTADGVSHDVEACGRCWAETIGRVQQAGRRRRSGRRRRRSSTE